MTPPPRSHRAPGGPAELARRLVAPLAAISAVVVVIVVLLLLNSRPTGGPGPAVAAPPSATSSAPASDSASPSAAPSPAPATAAAAPPAASPSAAAAPPVAARSAPVTVLNNSRRAGLAHVAARQVADAGWPLSRVGNFTGRVAASTVYYAPGQLALARRLAADLRGVRRVLPRFAGLPGSGLTLVVTRDWPRTG